MGPLLGLHVPRSLVLGGRLQVLLDAPVVLHLGGHGDGDGRATPAAGERAGPAVGHTGAVTGAALPSPQLKAHPCHSAPRGQPWDTPQEGGQRAEKPARSCWPWSPCRPACRPRGAGGSGPRWFPQAIHHLDYVLPAQSLQLGHPQGWGSLALAWDPPSARPGPAYPEGLGELLHGGEGDGVRPWLSRPAEATSELLAETQQKGS